MNRMRKKENQGKKGRNNETENERGMKDGNLMTRKRGDEEGSGQGRTKGGG